MVANTLKNSSFSQYRISSALTTVERQCAIINIVRCLATRSRPFCITFSVLESNPEVAQGKRIKKTKNTKDFGDRLAIEDDG